eukprot:g861.t1
MESAQTVGQDAMEPDRKRRRTVGGRGDCHERSVGGKDDGSLRFSRGDLDTYRRPPVPFRKPSHICDVSRDSKGVYHSDASEILKFAPPKSNCDLNKGYETWKHEELGRAELSFEPVMRAISEAVAKGAKKPRADFVMWRGNMTKLLCAPYGGNEDWEMSVYCRNGVLFVDSRETEACQMRKQSMDAKQRLWTYYGYKFEHYCTEGVSEDEPVDTSPGANYNAVRSVDVGNLRLVLCGEVDCYSAEPWRENFLELKTSKLIRNERARRSFEKHKLMKYWAQSFSIGVPRVVVGFRDDKGIVKKVQRFYTTKIPKLVQGREHDMWDHRVCINFMHALLCWVLSKVRGTDEPWLLRYRGSNARFIELKRGVLRKKHHVFPRHLYDAVEAREGAEKLPASVAASKQAGDASAYE